jgi:hypothetical protein
MDPVNTMPTEPRPARDKLLRIAGPAMLVVGIIGVLFALALTVTDEPEDLRVAGNPAIERLIPRPGSEVIRQGEVGIDLISGWEAELTIDGIPIPVDQMNILRDIDNPGSSAASRGTFGTTLNRFTYQPLEGRVIAELLGDRHCVLAEFWPLSSPTERQTTEWCFLSS